MQSTNRFFKYRYRNKYDKNVCLTISICIQSLSVSRRVAGSRNRYTYLVGADCTFNITINEKLRNGAFSLNKLLANRIRCGINKNLRKWQ